MQTTSSATSSELKIPSFIYTGGDVTQLNCLIGVSPGDLEARLGYEAGRLALGWYLLLLVQRVRADEFIWGGTTEFSGGTDPERTVGFQGRYDDKEIQYRVHVQDLLRSDFHEQFGGNNAKTEKAMESFRQSELRSLNDRSSHNRVAKVLPVIRHDREKVWYVQYPDAAAGHGVKQWTLLKKLEFRVAAKIPAGHRYLGGGRVGVD